VRREHTAVHYRNGRIGLAVAAALAVALLPSAGKATNGQQGAISAGVARAKALVASGGFDESGAKAYYDAIGCAERDLEAGRALLALHRLRDAYAEAAAAAYARSKAGVAKAGAAAFEREWRRLGGEVKSRERRLAAAGAPLPAAARAMIQAARGQSAPYYQSGRLYGLNASLGSGLFYSGLATSYLDYALVCRGVPPRAGKAAFRFVSVAPRIAELEAETVRAYDRADEAGRRKFIPVNSTLKLASELDGRGWYEGALYTYLEAVLAFGLLTEPAPDANRVASLGAAVRATAARLAADDTDHSIGTLFVEAAESALAGGCDSDGDRHAAVFVDRVLPRYFEYVGDRSQDPKPRTRNRK
jgi:hypothetical protein